MLRQLAFPWCPRRDVQVEEIRGDVALRVEVRAGPGDVELILRDASRGNPGDASHDGELLDVRLCVVPEVVCVIREQPHWWSFDLSNHRGDVFEVAIEWGIARLDAGCGSHDSWDATHARRQRFRAALRRHTTAAASLAWDMCVEPARSTALRLPGHARTFVYAALLTDRRGRVAQMVETCPALLVLTSTHAGASRLLRGIEDGEPLRDLLALALGPERAIRGAGVFVRRAPAAIPARVLSDAMDAPGGDVNDLPGEDDEQRTWFRWLATWHRISREWRSAAEGWRDQDAVAVGSFVSRHALTLQSITVAEDLEAHALLNMMLDAVTAAGGALPTRRSSPARVMAQVQAWHDRLWGSALAPSQPLRVGPIPATSSGVDAAPLTTVGELVAEGRAMRHCVASFAERAVSGELCFYRVNVGDERLTVALTDQPGRWCLVEASAAANHPPSETAYHAVAAWSDELNRRTSRPKEEA